MKQELAFDPDKIVNPEGFADFLKEKGVAGMTKRKALRLFAEKGFPRFFIGKSSFARLGPAWNWILSQEGKR